MDNVSHCDGTHTKCGRYSHLTAKVWVVVDHHVSHCNEVCAIVLDLYPTIFTEVIASDVSHYDGTRTKCGRYSQKNWSFCYWIEITAHSWRVYAEGLQDKIFNHGFNIGFQEKMVLEIKTGSMLQRTKSPRSRSNESFKFLSVLSESQIPKIKINCFWLGQWLPQQRWKLQERTEPWVVW